MERPTTARRHFVAAALTLSALLATAPASGPAAAAPREQPRRIPARVCDYDWRKGTWQIKHLIACAARRWKVKGGPDKALSVAKCESHFRADAYNSAGYLGIFQQARRYWPDRADRWGFPDRSAFNGRANIIVSVRMAHASGWGAWGCA
jgi:hypothetical protein